MPMDELGLSDEARELEPEPDLPLEEREFGAFELGRGRGALLLLAALGLGAFFAPWVVVYRPEDMVLRGFDLARGRAGWLWGGAVGYFMLLPLLWTRRTIARLRGARVITTLFAAMTALEIAVLVAFPPRRGLVPVELEWHWGLYLSALISAVATVCAVRLGGALPDRPSSEVGPPPSERGLLH